MSQARTLATEGIRSAEVDIQAQGGPRGNKQQITGRHARRHQVHEAFPVSRAQVCSNYTGEAELVSWARNGAKSS